MHSESTHRHSLSTRENTTAQRADRDLRSAMDFDVILNTTDIPPRSILLLDTVDSESSNRTAAAAVTKTDWNPHPTENAPRERSPSLVPWPQPVTVHISEPCKSKPPSPTGTPPRRSKRHSCKIPPTIIKNTRLQSTRTPTPAPSQPPTNTISPTPIHHSNQQAGLRLPMPLPSTDIIVSRSTVFPPSRVGAFMPSVLPVFKMEAKPQSKFSVGSTVSLLLAPQFGNILDGPTSGVSPNALLIDNLTLETHIHGIIIRVTEGSDGRRARALVLNECPWSETRFAEIDVPRSEEIMNRGRAEVSKGMISLMRKGDLDTKKLLGMKSFVLPGKDERCQGHLCLRSVRK